MSSNSCPVDVDENSPSVGESEGSVFDFVLDHPPPAERKEFVRRFRRQEQAESEAYSQQTPRSPPATFAAHNSVRSTGIFQRQQYLLPPPSSDPSAQPLYSERWPLSLETMLPSIDSSRGGGAPSGTAVMSGAGPLAPLAPNTASNTEAGGYSSRTDTAAASKSRISWHAGGELDKLLLIQVQGSQAHRSPHGQVAKVWRKVSGILSSLPEFAVYGGIKPDAAKKRCAELMASFRQENRNSEFKSGNRTGASEQVHRILWDLIQDEDADRDSKKVKAAASAEKEEKQSRRAEEIIAASQASSGSAVRKKRPAPKNRDEDVGAFLNVGPEIDSGGNISKPSSLAAAVVGYMDSLKESPETKRTKLQLQVSKMALETMRAETARVEANNRSKENEFLCQIAKKLSN